MSERLRLKQRWSARILLAVFVPLLLMASVHVHHYSMPAETACYECAHHIPHDGHLTGSLPSISPCVLCQFLSLPSLAPSALSVVAFVHFTLIVGICAVRRVCCRRAAVVALRAPPYTLF